ncbi:MAG: hypothetical protein GY754_32510 [bacterium]|nr:hypothetical protein [bacterium]
MNTIKETSIDAITRLPENCSIYDIMREIDFLAKRCRSFEEPGERKVVITDELLMKIGSWLEKG